MISKKLTVCGVSLVLLIAGCGSGEMSLTEYVAALNAVDAQASLKAEAIVASAEQIIESTPQPLQTGLELAGDIRIEVKEATDALRPPEQVADLHKLIFEWHDRFIPIEAALAVRASTAEHTDTSWTSLSESDEMYAYRAAIAEGKKMCDDFQTELDATSERGAFVDVPWIPGEMSEVVQAVLGCDWFPDRPEDLYRWPPPIPPPVLSGLVNEADVYNASDEQLGLVRWAFDRFSTLGLPSPSVVSITFPPTQACIVGHSGIAAHSEDGSSIDVCTESAEFDGAGTPSAMAQRTILHELAHIWSHQYTSAADAQRLLDQRGLTQWNDAVWELSGSEQAAEIIAWGLADEWTLPRVPDTACAGLIKALATLIGTVETPRALDCETGSVDY